MIPILLAIIGGGAFALLAYGLMGLAQSAAQRYLIFPGHLDREAAANVLAALAWRGISGFPKSHPPQSLQASSPSPPISQ